MSDRTTSTPRYFKDKHSGPFYSQPRRVHYLVRVDPDDSVWLEYADGELVRHKTMRVQEVMHHVKNGGTWVSASLDDLEGTAQ